MKRCAKLALRLTQQLISPGDLGRATQANYRPFVPPNPSISLLQLILNAHLMPIGNTIRQPCGIASSWAAFPRSFLGASQVGLLSLSLSLSLSLLAQP